MAGTAPPPGPGLGDRARAVQPTRPIVPSVDPMRIPSAVRSGSVPGASGRHLTGTATGTADDSEGCQWLTFRPNRPNRALLGAYSQPVGDQRDLKTGIGAIRSRVRISPSPPKK